MMGLERGHEESVDLNKAFLKLFFHGYIQVANYNCFWEKIWELRPPPACPPHVQIFPAAGAATANPAAAAAAAHTKTTSTGWG